MANDFIPFSTSGTANVYTNAEYIADADTTNGNQPGIAKSKLVNKALRQCSIISTVVAQYIADITGTNAVDDGTTATLLTNLKSATNVATNTHSATVKTTPVGADELGIYDSVSGLLNKLSFTNLWASLSTLFAPIASPTFTGTPAAPTATTGTNTTQLATTAYANAIAGGTTVPAKSLATNGYVKMANGLIIQWGFAACGTVANATVTFPISFPTASLSIVATRDFSVASWPWAVTAKSVSNFTLRNNSSLSGNFYWIAIGN